MRHGRRVYKLAVYLVMLCTSFGKELIARASVVPKVSVPGQPGLSTIVIGVIHAGSDGASAPEPLLQKIAVSSLGIHAQCFNPDPAYGCCDCSCNSCSSCSSGGC
jgi:hypothetical protein